MNLLIEVAGAVALFLILLGVRFGAIQAAIWLALTIVGQSATLLLIDAGTKVHYQHYRSLQDLLSGGFHLPLTIVSIQIVAVFIGTAVMRDRIAMFVSALLKLMRPWQWLTLGFVLFLCSATLSRDPVFFAQELVIASVAQVLSLTTVLLFVVSLPPAFVESVRIRLNLILDAAAGTRGIDRIVIIAALWVLIVSSALAVFSYQGHPHIPDEISYLYQARYFAQGMLSMPVPPVPAAFNLDLMSYEPQRWYSPVPPGWPAVLAIGSLIGLPWLVNPVLAGINVILTGMFVERFYDRRTSRITCVLLALSPWHVFMAINLMNHTAGFTFLLLAALAVQRMRETGNPWYGVPGGAALGVISLIRPLEGAVVAAALGLWSLGTRGRRIRLAPSVVLTLVTVLVGSVQLPYNAYLTGSAKVFPLMKYIDTVYGPGFNDLGFGSNRGLGWGLDPFPGHGLRDVLVNTHLNITAINVELLGWGIGSLLPIGLLLASGRMSRKEYQLGAVIVLVIGIHSLYWFSGGPDFGARYWYPVLLPCLLLTVRGIESLSHHLSLGGEELLRSRALFGVAALLVGATMTFFPWRAIDKYYNFRGMQPGVLALSKANAFGPSLILIRGNRHPDYASAAIYNPIDLKAREPIFAWDRDPSVRQQVLSAYSDRPVWFVDGPTVTNGGFEVAAGPMSIDAASLFPRIEHPKAPGEP